MNAGEKAEAKYSLNSTLSYWTDKTKIGLKHFKGDDNQVRLGYTAMGALPRPVCLSNGPLAVSWCLSICFGGRAAPLVATVPLKEASNVSIID